jgi:competence protein ComEC
MIYFLAFIYGISIFYIHSYFPLSSLAATLAVAILLMFFKKVKRLTIILAFVIVASGFSYGSVRHVHSFPHDELAGTTFIIRAETLSMPIAAQSGDLFSQTVEVIEAYKDAERINGITEIRVFSASPMSLGGIYDMEVKIPNDYYFVNPGSNNKLVSAFASGEPVLVRAKNGFLSKQRARLNEFMRDNFSQRSSPFLMSIITGERGFLSNETKTAFSKTGLAHILSISGAHFGLLLLVAFWCMRVVVRLIPYKALTVITLYLTPSQIAAVLSFPLVAGYFSISSMTLPSFRAFIMITISLLGMLLGRRGFWLNSLLFAAVVILLIQPNSILDLSAQLSFIAVLCIGIAAQKQDTTERQASSKSAALLNYFTAALKISFAASLGTAPLVAYYFNYFSVISPLTNLIITPLIGFIILPATIIASLIFLLSGYFPLLKIIDLITAYMLSLVDYAASLDFADIKIPHFPLALLFFFYAGILLYAAIRLNIEERKEGNAILLNKLLLPAAISIIPIIIYASFKLTEHKGIYVTYLDVGQGDSAVAELPDGKVVVIDTGKNGFQTAAFLRYRGINRINALSISHADSDHSGGLQYLIDNFIVDEIWDNGRIDYPSAISEKIKIRSLQRGDIIHGNGYSVIVLHPYEDFYSMHSDAADENNGSLVLKISARKNSFLFTADIEEEAEDDIYHLGEYLKSDVMKIPHHGGRTSAHEDFYEEVSPDIAVISAGRSNSYGHPHSETLSLLEDTDIYMTYADGAIGIKELKEGGLSVTTWGEFSLREAKTLRDEWMNFKKLFWVW